MGEGHDPALVGVEGEPEVREGRDRRLAGMPRLRLGLAGDHEVVRSAPGRNPPFELAVETIEHQVGEERRERRALRQALVARDAVPPVLDGRGHPGHHQVDERVVTQERRERHAEPPPIDAVEEVVDVGLVHEAAAACVGGPDGARRAMAGAAPAVAVAPVKHQLVEGRGEDLGDRPLGDPVEIRGDGQRPWFAFRAFEHQAPEGRRTVAAREQPFRKARQSILGGLLLARLFLGRGVLVFPGISLPLVSILTARLIFTSGLARVDGLVGEEEIGPLAGAPEQAHARLATGAGPIPVLGLEPYRPKPKARRWPIPVYWPRTSNRQAAKLGPGSAGNSRRPVRPPMACSRPSASR